FYGAPVLSGTYQGGSVSFPMTGLAPAAPAGMAAPAPTGPEFNVFVVLKRAGAAAAAKGDANGDGKVDVNDVFALVNYLYSHGSAPVGSGDVNGDGKTDVADVFYLVNYLFGGGPAPK
ncbi:MAG TPA: dockerin type I domain-containing protein, partial [Thermoanaerobaculia bacterium]|nr:dockerin type I domain-containing protein [Thermoanaerobaculia bacterium]